MREPHVTNNACGTIDSYGSESIGEMDVYASKSQWGQTESAQEAELKLERLTEESITTSQSMMDLGASPTHANPKARQIARQAHEAAPNEKTEKTCVRRVAAAKFSSENTFANQEDEAVATHVKFHVDLHDAPTPDTGTENMFNKPESRFAFKPGQLSKILNPKSLNAFRAMGGLAGLEKGLRTDIKNGLILDEDILDGAISFEDATSSYTSKPKRIENASRLTLPAAYRARRRRYLPLEINGKTTYGLPDNASVGNAITETWAQFIGAQIERPPSTHSFLNAQGQAFESVGMTQLVVSIPDPGSHNSPEKKWTCSFRVVKELAAPLVLGSSFIQQTGILSSLVHLLVKKTLSVTKDHWSGLKTVWRFMHMDRLTQNLECFVDNEQLSVSLDSGSDIDAVSLNYARSRGWRIQSCSEDEAYVLLADNQLVKLSGYIETTLGLQTRCNTKKQCVSKKLFVLDGLVCDVVLGDPTIETLDIFNEYKDCVVDTMEPDGTDAFRMIQCIEKIDQLANELEQMVQGDQHVTDGPQKQKRWNSIFRRVGLRKKGPVETQVTLHALKIMLEALDVCSANWRRAIEPELSMLVGQEYARRKEEIEKRKERNNQIRDRILLLIRDRLLTSTPGSASGSTTASPPG